METLTLLDGQYNSLIVKYNSDNSVVTIMFETIPTGDGFRRPRKLDNEWEKGDRIFVSFSYDGDIPLVEKISNLQVNGDFKFFSLTEKTSKNGNIYWVPDKCSHRNLSIKIREIKLTQIVAWED